LHAYLGINKRGDFSRNFEGYSMCLKEVSTSTENLCLEIPSGVLYIYVNYWALGNGYCNVSEGKLTFCKLLEIVLRPTD
jgi:hypothetical protein